ncbi:MAG: hypothetical protein H5T49_06665 [Hadesarchaea archaeon]|nr:hypothetical protein [Hadesarchaea archaeon]
MRANIKKLVLEMLSRESEGGLTKTKLDTIRALIHYHGAIWKSELVQELTMRASAAGSKLDMGQLNQGLQELENAGAVKIKKALRATLQSSSGVADELISIVDLHAAYTALAKDKKLGSF